MKWMMMITFAILSLKAFAGTSAADTTKKDTITPCECDSTLKIAKMRLINCQQALQIQQDLSYQLVLELKEIKTINRMSEREDKRYRRKMLWINATTGSVAIVLLILKLVQ